MLQKDTSIEQFDFDTVADTTQGMLSAVCNYVAHRLNLFTIRTQKTPKGSLYEHKKQFFDNTV